MIEYFLEDFRKKAASWREQLSVSLDEIRESFFLERKILELALEKSNLPVEVV